MVGVDGVGAAALVAGVLVEASPSDSALRSIPSDIRPSVGALPDSVMAGEASLALTESDSDMGFQSTPTVIRLMGLADMVTDIPQSTATDTAVPSPRPMRH